jgi:hypothetical protein
MRKLIVALTLILTAGVCRAQSAAWTVSAGYSNFNVAHQTEGVFYSKDGGYVDGDVSWLVSPRPVPVILGAGISVSGFYESEHVFTPQGYFPEERLQSSLSLVALEGRVGIPIQLGRRGGWFILPRLGAGLLIDDYAIDHVYTTDYHTGAAFEIRPAVQVGYSFGGWSMGAEASYMAAWGDFGRLGDNAGEFRVGVFARFKF